MTRQSHKLPAIYVFFVLCEHVEVLGNKFGEAGSNRSGAGTMKVFVRVPTVIRHDHKLRGRSHGA